MIEVFNRDDNQGGSAQMIERRSRVLALPALFVAAVVLLTSCGSSGQETEAAELEEDFAKVVNVEVLEIQPSGFTGYIRLTGEVEAYNDVVVSAEETGLIERFFIEKGSYVRKGEPIAKISDDVLRAQVDEAEASADLARERFERQRQLWEEEKIGSEIAYLEAKYQAQLQAARLETLRARLDRTLINSPISGVFDERHVDAGEIVAIGAPVGRVVDIDRLKVTGGVAERFAGSVGVKDTARVRLDVLGGQELVGTIGYVGATVETRSRTFPVEIVIDNPDRLVKPHMVANVEIANRRLEDALVIPQSSILRTEEGYQVFVVEERAGRLFAGARHVTLGPSYANRTVIEDGLDRGDLLIVRGQQMVEMNDRVRIVNDSAAMVSAVPR